MNSARFDEILRSVEHHHEHYLKNLRLLFEAQAANPRPTRAGSNDVTASPLLKAVSFGPGQSSGNRPRRATNESPQIQPALVFDGLMLAGEEHGDFLPLTPPSRPASTKALDTFAPSISAPLTQQLFSDEDLAAHIRSVDESSEDTVTALAEVWQRRNELDASNILSTFETGEGTRYESATYAVYEVGRDGGPTPKQILSEQAYSTGGDGDGDNRDSSVWTVLRNINGDGDAVGRMT
jgi:hypothetical protein